MHGTKFQIGTTTDFNIRKFDSENSTKLSNGLPNTYFLPRCAIARFSWLRCSSLSAMVEHYLSNSNSKLTITTEYNYHYGNCYEDESLLSQSRYASYLLPSHIPLRGRAPSLSAFSTAFVQSSICVQVLQKITENECYRSGLVISLCSLPFHRCRLCYRPYLKMLIIRHWCLICFLRKLPSSHTYLYSVKENWKHSAAELPNYYTRSKQTSSNHLSECVSLHSSAESMTEQT